MNEEKKMPEWGDVLHVDGDPVVVVRLRGGDWVEVADKFGKWHGLLMEDFDEYQSRTITVNGVEVPAPEREPLEIGQEYWLADITTGIPIEFAWSGNENVPDDYWLSNGFVHLNKENAQAHIDAVISANKGETG